MALLDSPSSTSRPSRRDFLRLGGLGAAGLALAACGGGSSGSAPAAGASAAPASFGDHLDAALLDQEHRVRRRVLRRLEGLLHRGRASPQVDLVTGPVDSADALVAAGNVTVGLSAPDATARFISEQGAPLKIIGSTFQKNPFCILSLEEGKPIRTPADLAARRSASRPAPTSRSSTGSSRPTTSTRPR